jgi:hypothetical protein
MVLTSFTVIAASGPTKKSTRARPWPSSARKAGHRHLAQLGGHVVVELGGHVELAHVVEVLRVEVVERGLADDADLGRERRHHGAVGPLQHGALDLAADDGRLDQHLRVVLRAVAMAASRSSHAVTRVMPSEDPARAGLTKTGRPSRSAFGVGQGRGAGPQHHVVAHREAVGGEQLLGELLVHARRAGQHARPDVGHARELQEALDRAVFAVGAVEHREHDVDAREHLPRAAGLQHEQAAARRVAGQRQRGAGGVDRGQGAVVDRQLAGVVGAHDPGAVGGDADRDDVEPLPVQVGQHAPGGHARDRVLAAAPAEDHRDPHPSRHGLRG